MFRSKFLSRMKRRLEARRKSKLQILKEGGQQALSHSPKDIFRIDFAMQRIKEGQYGICTNCGVTIEEGRLEVIPETPFCASCAQQLANQ